MSGLIVFSVKQKINVTSVQRNTIFFSVCILSVYIWCTLQISVVHLSASVDA